MKCIYNVDVSFDAVNGQVVNYRDVAMLRRVLWSVATATQQRDNCSTAAAMLGVNISHGLQQHAERERLRDVSDSPRLISVSVSHEASNCQHFLDEIILIWIFILIWQNMVFMQPRAGSKKQI